MWRWRRRTDEDFNEEIRENIAIDTDRFVAEGMSHKEAHDAALRAFGNVTRAQERFYEAGRMVWLDDLRRDVRHAFRTLYKNPGFAAVVVVTLGLGIGANTAVFSVINTVVLRSLPVERPDELVELLFKFPGDPRLNSYWWKHYEHFRDRNQVFSDLIAVSPAPLQVAGEAIQPEIVTGMYVVGKFFDVLGVRPAIGRLIGPLDDRVGSSDVSVAVISWPYWQSRFNGDPRVLGQTLMVTGVPATIIGVTPRGFFGIQLGVDPPVWLPTAMEPLIAEQSQLTAGTLPVALIGRRKPGVSLQQVQAEMRVLDRLRLADMEARFKDPRFRQVLIEASPAGAGLSVIRDRFGSALRVTMAAVAVLLVITCVNVASMLLARGAARRREMTVRVALGAGRFRLVRQVLTESLLLSTIGSLLGVLFAYFGAEALVRFIKSGRSPVGMPQPLEISSDLDLTVLMFAAAAALTTGLLFGLAPALSAFVSTPASSLREIGRVAETRKWRLFGKGLVVAQVALAVVMLAAATRFVRHLSDLRTVGVGFDAEPVLQVRLDRSHSRRTPEQLAPLYRQLWERMTSIPGVHSASAARMTPMSGTAGRLFVDVEGFVEHSDDRRRVAINGVTPGYFETLSTPLIAGRDFEPADAGGPLVAIINQAMARHYFGTGNPLGRQFTFEGQSRPLQIVGVVGDAKYNDLHETPPRTAYTNVLQGGNWPPTFLLRTDVAPTSIVADVRRVVSDVLPDVPIARVGTLADQLDASILPERMIAMLSTVFAVLAALLVAIGLYGLLAFTVTRRINEIGIRMALGATSRDVSGMVLAGALGLVGTGLLIGVPIALFAKGYASRILAVLAATQAMGPVTLPVDITLPILVAAVAMVAVALVASAVPAWRASLLSPMVAIRDQPESVWQAARQKVERAVRHLSRNDEQPVVPLGTLISEFADSVRRAGSVRDAADASLATLQERTGASSIMLLEKAGRVYRSRTCSIPAQGVLLNLLRHYPHPLALSQGYFDTWLRWARESRPEHVVEIEGLASTGVQTAVPLRTKNDVVGVLLLGPPADREQYTTAERQVLSNSGEVFALMLENARLTDRAVEQEKVRRDLAMAAEVQRRLLPPQAPRSAAATFAAFTLPARTIGGDYYDFLDLGGDQVGIAVADVSGKGISAALVMSVVQASLRVISSHRNWSLSQLAAQMNRFLYQSTEANRYATFFYAQVEDRGQRLRYVNAGHNPPYLVRGANGATEIIELCAGGTVLGLFPEVEFQEADIDLRTGDLLVAFTDGVTEALNSAGEEFGEERLKDVLRAAVGAPADEISTRLADTMRDWIGDAEQHDDLTFVVMAVNTTREEHTQ
jgi:predicted permease